MSSLFLQCCGFLLALALAELSSPSYFLLLITIYVFIIIGVTTSSGHSSLMDSLTFLLLLLSTLFFVTSSLLIFFIMYEFSLVPMSFIVFLFGYQPEKLSASTYLLVYTVLGSLPLFWYLAQHPGCLMTSFEHLTPTSSLLVSLSFLIKSPMFTLHAWLPKAHTEAPLIGSILLSGILLKFGGYGLIVLSPYLFHFASYYVYASLLGGIICSVLCTRSWDMKSLVAYSSIVHIGLVTIGCLRGTEVGFWSAMWAILAHSLLSPLLFRIAYEFYRFTSSRAFLYIHGSSIPSTFLLLVATYSGLNFGLPPSLGFWVELAIVEAVGSIWCLGLFTLIFASYLAFLYCIIFFLRSCGGRSLATVSIPFNTYPFLTPIFLSLFLPFTVTRL